jgi:hypothetical protein
LTLKSAIYDTAKDCFGTGTNRSKDWFDVFSHTLIPVLDAKNEAYRNYNTRPTARSLSKFNSPKKQCPEKNQIILKPSLVKLM